ncbi:MAG: two pore domain potassium channel family protein [Xanthomonadales bacterium]|nr:two pore domain potassium channel family protein [Xanthomonadales bacterium]
MLLTLRKWNYTSVEHFWQITRVLLIVAGCLILLHLAEIAVWGSFYLWAGAMPDAGSALYFSGVTYTTVGYGDLVLGESWRPLAPIEALTGILMCAMSAGYFFSVIHSIYHMK